MTKNYLIVAAFITFIFVACSNGGDQKQANTPTDADSAAHNIIRKTLRNEAGLPMDMTFDNTDNTAIVEFEGAVIKLKQQPSGSGIWYSNPQYELRGKGNDMTLTKDGEIIFRTAEDEL